MTRYLFNRRPNRKSGFRFIPVLLIVLVTVWIAGLLDFVRQIPDAVPDRTIASDGIVVLTGGSKRIETGLSLVRDGIADRLYVSGVDPRVTPEKIGSLVGDGETDLPDDLVRCCIEVGHLARDTIGNAREISAWKRRDGLRIVRLVTANYHMPRAIAEVSRLSPDLKLVPHPVFPDDVMVDEWWLWPGTTRLIILEYHKTLLAKLRHRIADLLD